MPPFSLAMAFILGSKECAKGCENLAAENEIREGVRET